MADNSMAFENWNDLVDYATENEIITGGNVERVGVVWVILDTTKRAGATITSETND